MICPSCGTNNVAGATSCVSCGAALPASTNKIGPYELRGELGRGAMARVWRAWDPNLEREVAIKEPLFAPGYSDEIISQMGKRFVSEGRAAARLNHPNIVQIYAADVYDGRPAIIMELVNGVTLASLMDSHRLQPSESLSVLDQLLDAVGYAHANGIIHRDIKPDNIFVSRDGLVKLADFGIARIESAETRATVAGTVLGTPGYMSPEQATGAKVDARSDLFSIGVIAYELLTGRNPFGVGDGSDIATLIYRIVHEEPMEIPASAAAGLPANVRPTVMCALEKNPDARPQSAAAFRGMLNGTQTLPAARSSQIGSLVGRASSGSSRVPYIAVASIASIAIIGLLVNAMSGTGGGGGAAASSAQTAYQSEAEGEQSAAAQSDEDQASGEALSASTESVVSSAAPVFTRASASSIYQEEPIGFYEPAFVLDGNPNYAWCESSSGSGEGEWIQISADSPQHVSGIRIKAGYSKNDTVYYSNCRPRDITLSFSDGSSVSVTLGDMVNTYQDISLSRPVDTSYVRITIDSVYAGEYSDCLIDEIVAY